MINASFLEIVNDLMSSGEIYELFSENELIPLLNDLRSHYIKEHIDEPHPNKDDSYQYFIGRVRNHLHIVLFVSPTGDFFANSVRLYPALINCASIKWFNNWPQTALKEVASHFLCDIQSEIDGGNKAMIMDIIPSIFCHVHTCAVAMCQKMAINEKRIVYVTPSNYLNLVAEYSKLLKAKNSKIECSSSKLVNGLQKIDSCKKQVSEMSVDLEKMKLIVGKKQIECEKLLVQIIQQKREADEIEKIKMRD